MEVVPIIVGCIRKERSLRHLPTLVGIIHGTLRVVSKWLRPAGLGWNLAVLTAKLKTN
jgi:hypothetical protein